MPSSRTKSGKSGRAAAPARPAAGAPLSLSLLAAIDVGATASRLQVAEHHPDGRLKTIESLVSPLPLGADTFTAGYVRPDALRALCRILGNFRKVMDVYKIDAVRCVATSAVREASNHDMVVDRVRHETGLSIEVIDAVEETRLAWQILVPCLGPLLDNPQDCTLAVTLGGGMTDIMLLQGRDIAFASSRRLGTARLLYAAQPAQLEGASTILENTIRTIVDSTVDLYRDYPIRRLVVSNPHLARAAATHEAARRLACGVILPSEAARSLAAGAEHLTAIALAHSFRMNQAEAEMLSPAFLIMERLVEMLPAPEVVLVDVDTISSLLDDLARSRRETTRLNDFAKQIIRSAQALGARYRYSRVHADQVRLLSAQLFDALAGLLDLGAPDRLLLEVAATVHDIGMYVSEASHHKHGAYLVRWSEIVGIPEADRAHIAMMVRYHRRALPSAAHDDFMALPPAARMRIRKLAGILRVADALDRTHEAALAIAQVEVLEDAVLIHVDAKGVTDLAVEQAALLDKGRLLEQITGLPIRLRRRVEA